MMFFEPNDNSRTYQGIYLGKYLPKDLWKYLPRNLWKYLPKNVWKFLRSKQLDLTYSASDIEHCDIVLNQIVIYKIIFIFRL